MNRRKFFGLAGGGLAIAAGAGYLLSDRKNVVRLIEPQQDEKSQFKDFEREILTFGSLAPSGHNSQPWFIKYLAPYHWIICNDKTRWLPAVDPIQRESLLSIGAFTQNIILAANSFGFDCDLNLLASKNQDEEILELRLKKQSVAKPFDIEKIKQRRTLRTGYLNEPIKTQDLNQIIGNEEEFVRFVDNRSKEHQWLNEQTIEANRQQIYRDDAQQELAEWIRFSSKEAKANQDGLTTASMEMNGIVGWVVRNFFTKEKVMEKGFREQGLDNVRKQVEKSGGWMIISSGDESVSGLLEAGMRYQRIGLKVRDHQIAIHPMSQILEEGPYKQKASNALGITGPVQFLIRMGYVTKYPLPVSLRRPIEQIIKL